MCVASSFGTFMWSQVHGEHISTARRRRERRLRQWLRHERLSVAPGREQPPRSPTETEEGQGRGREERAELDGHDPGDPLPQPELFELSVDEEPGGMRPDRIACVRPQERVHRHTAAHIVDVSPFVQVLDVPVPQTGNQLLEEVLKMHDIVTPEQVVAVPKISSLCCAADGGSSWRRACCRVCDSSVQRADR